MHENRLVRALGSFSNDLKSSLYIKQFLTASDFVMYKCTVYNILDAHKEERPIQDRYFLISFCQWGYRLWKKWFVAGGWNCLRSDESNVRLWKAIRCCTLRRSMELAIGCSAVIETLSILRKYGNIRY